MKYALVVLGLLVSLSLHAEIYKWKDENGAVHFSDAKPADDATKPAPKVETVELTPITIMQDGSVTNSSNLTVNMLDQFKDKLGTLASDIGISGAAPDKKSKAQVEIYTTSWCGACKKAKSWLRSKGSTYKEYDVEKNREAAIRMQNLGGGGGVPFAVINGDKLNGFSEEAYKAALGK